MIFAISSHVGFINNEASSGISTQLSLYLRKRGKDYILIEHCLLGESQSQKKIFLTGKQTSVKKIGMLHRWPLLFRAFEHFLLNILNVIDFIKKKPNEEIVFLGVDPVNSLSGFYLKLIGKIKKNIFICADYAELRYTNIIVNSLYHFVDKIALNGADEVWCVSSRIAKKREMQGVNKTIIKLLPNSPFYLQVPKSRSNSTDFIVVTHFNKSFDIEKLLTILKNVNIKYKNIKLKIIGGGPEEGRIMRAVSMSKEKKNVRFLGLLNQQEVLMHISNSFLGIALYTAENPWNYYGDSMKAREYAAVGIPLIINSIPSTSDDVQKYNAGFVINERTETTEIINFINKCIEDRDYYNSLSKNALKLGRDFDKEKILNMLFHKYNE